MRLDHVTDGECLSTRATWGLAGLLTGITLPLLATLPWCSRLPNDEIQIALVPLGDVRALAQDASESSSEREVEAAKADDPRPRTFLEPNVADEDGAPAFVHVSEEDMPLRVAVAAPPLPPSDGSRRDAREAAMAAVRLWELAISPHLPWFRIEFVEKDRTAAVQIRSRRRIGGDIVGLGHIVPRVEGGRLYVGGFIEIEVTNSVFYTRDWVKLIVAHEFGHVLGLKHCLDCESVMNYSSETRERVMVTNLDVATLLDLVSRPSGFRVDGHPMRSLLARGWLVPEEADPSSIDPASP
jgi:hypothetical protein